jgi:plastocyanin
MMRKSSGRISATLITAAAGVALLAACGSPGTTTAAPPGMTGMAMATAAPDAAAVTPVATHTVAVQNFAFSPASVSVKAGSTVTWTNQDQDPHDVVAMNDGPFHSPPLNTGQSFSYTFATPGRFDYLCTIHPFMTATVVVTP